MALPEDLAVELAENREWENLRDTVEQAHEDIDNECGSCGRRVYGPDPEPHALNCGLVLDEFLYGEGGPLSGGLDG